MSPLSKFHLTVIIPTRNRTELLQKTLRGLCEQTAPESLLEVIVVSDGSPDSTREMVQEFSSRLPIKFLAQPHRGVSSARNLGLGHASGDLVLFLDDDVVPTPQLIEAHVGFHDQMPELEAVLLGYVTWHPALHVTPYMRWYGEYGGLFAFSRFTETRPIPARFFYSCNISLKRRFLLEHGGFNEALTVLEDNELGYRLAQCGMKLFFRSAALGHHYQTFSFEQSCNRLERYSPGLDPFLKTPAGRAMVRRRNGLLFRTAERLVRMVAPLLGFLLRVIDSETKMPNFVYRIFYWYHGTYLAFWSRADAFLLRRGSLEGPHGS